MSYEMYSDLACVAGRGNITIPEVLRRIIGDATSKGAIWSHYYAQFPANLIKGFYNNLSAMELSPNVCDCCSSRCSSLYLMEFDQNKSVDGVTLEDDDDTGEGGTMFKWVDVNDGEPASICMPRILKLCYHCAQQSDVLNTCEVK
tara:strand:- start:223 stop:657 length:435 start_codon:yes stop_codon:yes gene_type:complete